MLDNWRKSSDHIWSYRSHISSDGVGDSTNRKSVVSWVLVAVFEALSMAAVVEAAVVAAVAAVVVAVIIMKAASSCIFCN